MRVIAIAALVAAGGMFVVGYPPNPELRRSAVASRETLASTLSPPVEISAMLDRACRDCHSNETRWPWYAGLGLPSRFMEKQVEAGRRALNFSEWTVRSGRTPGMAVGALTAACESVRQGRMPPVLYRLTHRSAELTGRDVDGFCHWTMGEFYTIREANAAGK